MLEADLQRAKLSAASASKPAILIAAAHHSRELITIQQSLFTALKLLHGGIVHNDPYYKNLLDSNLFYFVPVVNADGLNLIEQDFKKTGKVLKKRKNQNPQAMQSLANVPCKPEDSGVDLNRNYGMDWGAGNRKDYGHGVEDECADPCGECYRGASAFSEKET